MKYWLRNKDNREIISVPSFTSSHALSQLGCFVLFGSQSCHVELVITMV